MLTPRQFTAKPSSSRMTPSSRRSSFLPPSASNRGRTPNRSNLNNSSMSFLQTSHILGETDNHIVEAFGATLPVVVTEILTLSERVGDVSVSLSPNGWAWLVHGRRLVVWRYNKATNKPFSANCRELTLPPSDLAHNSRLVNVFAASENQTPSCIAVSPEGLVRYWPSIAHAGSSYEVNSDLQGQECYSLCDLQPLGSILSTTTSSVVLIHQGEHHAISCRALKPPQGLLGGIGRRVSSLLWGGAISSGNAEAKLVQVLGTSPSMQDPFEKVVFVLTSHSFQKWLLYQGEADRMIYNCDVETLAKQALATHLWNQENIDWIKVWVLDMQLVNNGEAVAVLTAGQNPQVDPDNLHYAIGVMNTMSNGPPVQFRNVTVLNYTVPYVESQDVNNSQMTIPGCDFKLIMPEDMNWAFVYNSSLSLCFPCSGSTEEPEQLDFSNGGNAILGAGYSSEGLALFFSVTHGMISIQPSHQPAKDKSNLTFNDSIMAEKATKLSETLNLSVSQAGLDNLTMSESKKDQLKAAFLFFCKRDFGNATSIVDELFSDDAPQEADSTLDRLVVSMSADLIDDYPASDPRWMKSLPNSAASVGSTMSLLILHQLEDKKTALEVYISFLKEVGLWKKLGPKSVQELAEHVEKTSTTIMLRTIHAEHQPVVDAAIRETLKLRKVSLSEPDLTPQDHFYRSISKIEEISNGFQLVAEKAVASGTPRDIKEVVMSANAVIMSMMREALKVRGQLNPTIVYLPWTSTPGPRGLRTLLMKQFNLTMDKVIKTLANDERMDLVAQTLSMADFILDGYRSQITNLDLEGGCTKSYEKDRSTLVLAFIEIGCLEEAASLAEKYLEFNGLVKICELSCDNERLERYMDIFAEHNFANFVFDWHIKEGKQAKLLKGNYARNNQLGSYLKGHSELSWMHEIETQNFVDAVNTLKALAYNENENVAHKKNLLSIAKLALLASDEAPEAADIELRSLEYDLNLIMAQEQLPPVILESYGFDPKVMRPLNARELIELYIGDDNPESDHVDFKKALDLVEYIAPNQDIEAEKEALRLRIWARSVIKDSWITMNTDQPVEAIKDTVFFKLVEFCYLQGLDLKDNMPAPDRLLEAEELGALKSNANFQFLLRTGYEHVRRHCSGQDDSTMMVE